MLERVFSVDEERDGAVELPEGAVLGRHVHEVGLYDDATRTFHARPGKCPECGGELEEIERVISDDESCVEELELACACGATIQLPEPSSPGRPGR